MVVSRRLVLSGTVACVILVLAALWHLSAAPQAFPTGSIFVIPSGATVSQVADQLANDRVISSPTVFELILKVTGQGAHLQAGAYLLKEPQSVVTIARRLVIGDYQMPMVKITLPEGITVREIAMEVASELPRVSADAFKTLAKPQEGYLFPDTYYFSPGASTTEVVNLLRSNFDIKIASLQQDIAASGHSLADIITIASLVEKEARSVQNKKLVAGVLWSRLKVGMPLQVDAMFGYIFNRDTYAPSPSDLKVNSPYNLYLHKGLPPTPINNPGLESINAALHPTPSDYLYYLTGSDNLMHYARTYAEHQANLKKYLK